MGFSGLSGQMSVEHLSGNGQGRFAGIGGLHHEYRLEKIAA